jgi:hypothetical protein
MVGVFLNHSESRRSGCRTRRLRSAALLFSLRLIRWPSRRVEQGVEHSLRVSQKVMHDLVVLGLIAAS